MGVLGCLWSIAVRNRQLSSYRGEYILKYQTSFRKKYGCAHGLASTFLPIGQNNESQIMQTKHDIKIKDEPS